MALLTIMLGKLAAFRAKAALAEEAQKRITAATIRTHQAAAAGNDSSMAIESAADLAALLADHKSVCIDMRTLARSLGTDRFQQQIEESVTAAHRKGSPATLRIHTGAPMSFFDPAAWVGGLVEFFHGDCAPNLDRPAKISWRHLFKYLMNREELEYHLDSDKCTANPILPIQTPGGIRQSSLRSLWMRSGSYQCSRARKHYGRRPATRSDKT